VAVVKIRLPGAPDDVQDAINAHAEALDARKRRNRLRLSYYDSKRLLPKVASGIIPQQYYNLGLCLGWASKAVDQLANRTNLDGFTWADGDLDSLGMGEIWEDNRLGAEIDLAITANLSIGPAFLITHQGETGEPDALIHVKDALHASGTWNTRKRAMDDLLSVTAFDDEGNISQFAYYADNITYMAQKPKGRKWAWTPQEHRLGVPVERMAYKPTPSRPFGTSRITRPVMGLQDAATRALIRLEGHMDVYSQPEFWLLGADETVFKNADGTLRDIVSVRLGRIKGIPDDVDAPEGSERADIKHFPAEDPAPHLADLNLLAKLFANEASLPHTSVAITDYANPTSADSYDASQHELIGVAEIATDGWGPDIKRAVVRALAIKNNVSFAEAWTQWKGIQPDWRDPRYTSRAAQADAGQKIIASAPALANTEVGLKMLGLSPQDVKLAMSEMKSQRAVTSIAEQIARLAAPEAPANGTAS